MIGWKYAWVVVGVLFFSEASLLAEPPAGPSLAEDLRVSHLRKRIDSALALTERRFLSPERHNPWQIAHGMIAFGREFRLRRASGSEYLSGVDYFCKEGTFNGMRIFQPSPYGLEPVSGGGLEGHPNQFLAVFAQSGLPGDHPIQVDGRDYRIFDLVEQAKMDYYDGEEASWTLISFATYLPLDATWENRAGRRFSIEDLVRAEVSSEPTTGACGGTHNLYALAYALKRVRAVRQRLTGAWSDAAAKVARYHEIAHSLQNADGSLSARYFEGPGTAADDTEKLDTTGHTLEWLALSLSDDEIRQPWVPDSVDSLLGAFERTRRSPLDCGPLYHAAHALVLYRDRLALADGPLVQVPASVGSEPIGGTPPVGSADPAAP